MRNKISKIAIGCCAVFFCAASEFAIVDLTGVHGGGNDYSAKNSLLLTSTYNIQLEDQYELVDIGHLVTSWSHFGENNFVGTSVNPGMISDPSGPISIGNIERNFWGFVDPSALILVPIDPILGGGTTGHWDAGGTVSYSSGIAYTATTNTRTAETIIPFSVSCSGGFTIIKGKENEPLSIPTMDSCSGMHGWAGVRPQNQQEYKMQYDTLRRYIESCGKNDDSYDVFSTMDGAVKLYAPNDTTRYDRYREWLISVLYLNTTKSAYFCACMQSIAGSYQYGKYYPLGYLAVIKYLRGNQSCDDVGLEKEFTKDSTYDAQHGYDVTHLPSMQDLGLDSILRLHAIATPPTRFPPTYLATFNSSPNPFINETTLQFILNRMTYTTVAVYDELGRLVWGYPGASLEAGMHTIHLDGKNLPSGTLYARISTGFGEVKTVKLVHDK